MTYVGGWTQVTLPVEQFAVRLRSDLHRASWRAVHGHRDNETMARYCLRRMRRAGAVDVDDPVWHYLPDFEGPGATQAAVVRCVRPRDQQERDALPANFRVGDTAWLNLAIPSAD